MSVRGTTKFAEKDDRGVRIMSNWAFCEGEVEHSLAIIDNNLPDCKGTPLRAIESKFTTNLMGFGGVFVQDTNLQLNGPQSIVNKYLALNTTSGCSACCQILTDEKDNT